MPNPTTDITEETALRVLRTVYFNNSILDAKEGDFIPWHPTRMAPLSYRSICMKLEDMGLAEYYTTFEPRWVLTEAGAAYLKVQQI